jgi:hypothetical protein
VCVHVCVRECVLCVCVCVCVVTNHAGVRVCVTTFVEAQRGLELKISANEIICSFVLCFFCVL